MANSASSPIHTNVVPYEVGWQFVTKYYTFVNKHPNRLHCFYSKTSTFSHGTEGEECIPCHGQQSIHNKITSIGFQDCKVYIHSVDAQSSANGGIIIQVIGEMANEGDSNGHGELWRKFVQTFFLAEQPTGYFVLNDIFRFLREESIENEETTETDATAPDSDPAPAPTLELVAEPKVPAYEPEPVLASAPVPVSEPATEELATLTTPELTTTPSQTQAQETGPHTNGVRTPPAEPAAFAPSPTLEQAAPQLAPTARAVTPPPTAVPATPAPPPQVTQTVAPTPTPPAVKTWANLAAQNPKKWGSAVAQESRGTTEVPVAPSSPAPAPREQGASVAHSHGTGVGRGMGQHGQREHGQRDQHPRESHGSKESHPLYIAAQSISTPQVFVKGVTEGVTHSLLTSVLTTRFGGIKEMEIVRYKACAFLEFNTLESARKAILASLPQAAGGDGGIRIDVPGEANQVRISVEMRKERADRPVSRPRGGGANGDQHRGGGGSYRGGRGGPGRGRGGASGNVPAPSPKAP